MSRILVALLVFVGLAAGVAGFVALDDDMRSRGALSKVRGLGDSVADAATIAPATVDAAENAPLFVEEAPSVREVVASAPPEEFARARWIEGLVVFPPDTPADERVFVVARGTGEREYRTEVGPDGSFRAALGESARTGRVRLEARYLYLDEEIPWRRKEHLDPNVPAPRVVLRPTVGARLVGRVRPPVGTEARGVGGRVQLLGSMLTRALTEKLEFAFDALPTEGVTFELLYDGSAFIGKSGALALAAGRCTTVELELRPGIVLAGFVRDEARLPIAGAAVEASTGQGWGIFSSRSARSGADGSFRLGPLDGSPQLELSASCQGFEARTRDLGYLREGTGLLELELVLSRGQTIAGCVLWPDGVPAKASVWLTRAGDGPGKPFTGGQCDASGVFRIDGLGDAPYGVRARAVRVDERGAHVPWIAEAEAVPAGTLDLRVTLEPTLTLAGRVRDTSGAAVPAFRVRALPRGSDHSGKGSISRNFRGADGGFVLGGFSAGEWELRASGRGYAESEPVRVKVPDDGPVTLVLRREVSR